MVVGGYSGDIPGFPVRCVSWGTMDIRGIAFAIQRCVSQLIGQHVAVDGSLTLPRRKINQGENRNEIKKETLYMHEVPRPSLYLVPS